MVAAKSLTNLSIFNDWAHLDSMLKTPRWLSFIPYCCSEMVFDQLAKKLHSHTALLTGVSILHSLKSSWNTFKGNTTNSMREVIWFFCFLSETLLVWYSSCFNILLKNSANKKKTVLHARKCCFYGGVLGFHAYSTISCQVTGLICYFSCTCFLFSFFFNVFS